MCQCKEQNYATENKKNRGSEIESLFLEITISYLPSFYPYPPTVKPQYNEGLRDWGNLFTITVLCYIKVLFNIFYY